MTVGKLLTSRFKILGIRACGQCLELAKTMDERGIRWCQENIDMLSKQIGNRIGLSSEWRMRFAHIIPKGIRQRWIKRQITIAIKQARRQNHAIHGHE